MFARQMGAGGVKKEEWHSKMRLSMESPRNSQQFSVADCRVRGKRQAAGQVGLRREAGEQIMEDSMLRGVPWPHTHFHPSSQAKLRKVHERGWDGKWETRGHCRAVGAVMKNTGSMRLEEGKIIRIWEEIRWCGRWLWGRGRGFKMEELGIAPRLLAQSKSQCR